MTKILILDIETSPNIAYVWRFFKENISPKQVLEHTEILSFAAKWLGEDQVFYTDQQEGDEKFLLTILKGLLDDADIVVAHNGSRFDLPTITGRFLINEIKPPSPYKIIDTVTVARNEFNFPSNSLEYLSGIFGVDKKDDHKKFPGFELWIECLKNNPEAWEEMRLYNIQDVVTLEQIYLKMRPFIRNHPNVALINGDEKQACPKCGSNHIHWRGFAHTSVGKYHRYQCADCGGWGRSRFTVVEPAIRKNLLVNAR